MIKFTYAIKATPFERRARKITGLRGTSPMTAGLPKQPQFTGIPPRLAGHRFGSPPVPLSGLYPSLFFPLSFFLVIHWRHVGQLNIQRRHRMLYFAKRLSQRNQQQQQ